MHQKTADSRSKRQHERLRTITRFALVGLACASIFSAAAFGGSVTDPPGGSDCQPGQITNQTPPSVSGAGTVHSSIITTTGAWTVCQGQVAYYTYEWLRDGITIPGTPASSYWARTSDLGHVIRSRVNACTADGSCGTAVQSSNSVTVSGSAPQQVSMRTFSGYVDFTNVDGTWRFYTECGHRVGPGFAARLVAKSGATVFDAANPPGGASVGVGQFHARLARATKPNGGNGPTLFYGYTDRGGHNNTYRDTSMAGWELQDLDASGNHHFLQENGRTYVLDGNQCGDPTLPLYWCRVGCLSGHLGVSPDSALTHTLNATLEGGASVATPSYDSDSDVGYFNEQVAFEDPYWNSLLTILYQWKVYPTTVKMWATVVEGCDYGACGTKVDGSAVWTAWLKGPKFVAGIDNTRPAIVASENYNQMTVYNAAGGGICSWANIGDPSSGTGVCSAKYGTTCTPGPGCSVDNNGERTRIQFNYAYSDPNGGESDPTADPNCAATTVPGSGTRTAGDGCFNAVFRSYPPDSPVFSGGLGATPGNSTNYWMRSGLIDFANNISFQPSEQDQQPNPCSPDPDPPPPGQSPNINCYYCNLNYGWGHTTTPASGGAQRWELVGVKPGTDKRRQFDSAAGFAFGWSDCILVHDASGFYRRFESANANYSVYGSFGFNKPGFSHYDISGQN